jgi:hypothetical protein
LVQEIQRQITTHDIVAISDYLSIMVKGALSVSDFMTITDETLVRCLEKDIHKVVIDVTDAAGTFSDSDKIEFAKYAVEILKDEVVKYAYVYPHKLLNYSSQFVAQGRGLNARAFYTLEDALEWIEAS